MITAKDLCKHIKEREDTVGFEQRVDDWLKEEVFPEFKGMSGNFEKPRDMDLKNLLVSLQLRGFHVDYFAYRHPNAQIMIKLTIPQQTR